MQKQLRVATPPTADAPLPHNSKNITYVFKTRDEMKSTAPPLSISRIQKTPSHANLHEAPEVEVPMTQMKDTAKETSDAELCRPE